MYAVKFSDKSSTNTKDISAKSLAGLSIFDLQLKIFDQQTSHQDILDAAFELVKQGQIQAREYTNLLFNMQNREDLSLFKLKHESPEVRALLFNELMSRVGGSISYWSGCEEARNPDFKSLVQDVGKLRTNPSLLQIQDRAIRALARLAISQDLAGGRVAEIAHAFLALPPGLGTHPFYRAEIKGEIQKKLDSILLLKRQKRKTILFSLEQTFESALKQTKEVQIKNSFDELLPSILHFSGQDPLRPVDAQFLIQMRTHGFFKPEKPWIAEQFTNQLKSEI